MNQFQKIKTFLYSIEVSESVVRKSINDAVDCEKGILVTYINQNSFNEYYTNTEFRDALSLNFKCFSDGKGMSYAIEYLFGKKVDKFNATDLYTDLFDSFFKKGISTFIIGGNYNYEMLQQKLHDKIILSGYSDGYFNEQQIEQLIEKIKVSGAKVIGIGMGTPKQELLALRISSALKNSIILCVGNFINFQSGLTKRAPKYLINSGFEWIHRLFIEPKKLWKRYIIGIPKFIFRVLSIKFS